MHRRGPVVREVGVYDNSAAAEPFRLIVTYADGRSTGDPVWPPWTPSKLRRAGR